MGGDKKGRKAVKPAAIRRSKAASGNGRKESKGIRASKEHGGGNEDLPDAKQPAAMELPVQRASARMAMQADRLKADQEAALRSLVESQADENQQLCIALRTALAALESEKRRRRDCEQILKAHSLDAEDDEEFLNDAEIPDAHDSTSYIPHRAGSGAPIGAALPSRAAAGAATPSSRGGAAGRGGGGQRRDDGGTSGRGGGGGGGGPSGGPSGSPSGAA